jgi:hypothetical protein
LVFEDDEDGVVGFVGSNPRPFSFRGSPVRIACSGPIVVSDKHRRRGLGTILKRTYGEGPQEMTVNDRVVDRVHSAWERLGAITDTPGSLEWVVALAPLGARVESAAPRIAGRRLPVAALVRPLDSSARRRHETPLDGGSEPLTAEAMVDVLERIRPHFQLAPVYDTASAEWAFGALELVDPDLGRPVRRLVRAKDGSPLGFYVAFVARHGKAQVVHLASAPGDSGLLLDHLFADMSRQGAVEVRGRLSAYLLAALARRKASFEASYWSIFQCEDPELTGAVLKGDVLMTRLEGEWWMRPWQRRSPLRRLRG